MGTIYIPNTWKEETLNIKRLVSLEFGIHTAESQKLHIPIRRTFNFWTKLCPDINTYYDHYISGLEIKWSDHFRPPTPFCIVHSIFGPETRPWLKNWPSYFRTHFRDYFNSGSFLCWSEHKDSLYLVILT